MEPSAPERADALPGRVEAATLAALDRLGKLDEGVREPLREMAIRMARAYDQYVGADLTKLARLNQELRQTLAALTEVAGDDDGDESARLSTPVFADLSAPVRDAPQS